MKKKDEKKNNQNQIELITNMNCCDFDNNKKWKCKITGRFQT